MPKLIERECPVCHKKKPFRADQACCSAKCGRVAGHKTRREKYPPKDAEAGTEERHEVAGDSWTVSIPKTRIHTLAQLLEYCEVDEALWSVERFVVNKWEMGAKVNGEHGESMLVAEPLYQVKAWLKKRVTVEAARQEIAALKADALSSIKLATPSSPRPPKKGYMLELSLPDAHLGKLCWGRETGWEHYDTGIAVTLFEEAVEALLARSAAFQYDRVLFVPGNDLLNSDNLIGTTTGGTPQANDSRFQKVYVAARRMLCRVVERLVRDVAPVSVLVLPGNHDQQSAWCLGDSLECYFNKAKHVSVDNAPTPRKYFSHGRVMLMFTHGDKGKRADYGKIMATERPIQWGQAWWREIHTGDKHQVRLEESHGVRVRILPSLSPPDAWHSNMGYVGNLRSAESYMWHAEHGHVGTAIYTLPPSLEVAA